MARIAIAREQIGTPQQYADLRQLGRLQLERADVDPALAVSAVHEQVDEIEHGLRQRFPSVKRVRAGLFEIVIILISGF